MFFVLRCCHHVVGKSASLVSLYRQLSYYDTLGLQRTATHEDIKNRYYKLSKKYHPDVNKTEKGVDKFRAVAEAYSVLGSVDERRRYDKIMVDNLGRGNPASNRVTVDQDFAKHLGERFHHSKRYRPKRRKRNSQSGYDPTKCPRRVHPELSAHPLLYMFVGFLPLFIGYIYMKMAGI